MTNSTGADKVLFNVTKNCFGKVSNIMRYVVYLSLQTVKFPNILKIEKVISVFKTGDLIHYRLISVLPCFSRILEPIIQNRPYS